MRTSSRDHPLVDFVLLNRRLATEDTPLGKQNTVPSLLENSATCLEHQENWGYDNTW